MAEPLTNAEKTAVLESLGWDWSGSPQDGVPFPAQAAAPTFDAIEQIIASRLRPDVDEAEEDGPRVYTDPGGPENGHTFRFVWSSRGSYSVSGVPGHSDSGWFGPDTTVEIRAWNLRGAIQKFLDLPNAQQMGYPDE